MDEIEAQKKYACPMCGGEARWDPARQALVCVYCGSVTPVKTGDAGSGVVQEHPLAAALRAVPDTERGWMTETHSVRCQSCQAISVFPAGQAAGRCAFCGSAALVDYQALRAPIRPESLLAFQVSESQARDAVRAWYGSRWFAPNQLKRAALTDTVRGVYLPFWTFDAQALCPWTAEAGTYYYETETYEENGEEKTRQVRQTRWEDAEGLVRHFFDDELVSGSKGVSGKLMAQIEPFPTVDQLVPYDGGYLAGWTVEQYQVDLAEASARAEATMETELRPMCSREVPGDTQRELQIFPEYTAQTFKHVLLPVWVLSYDYLGTAYQVLINGYTGRIAGDYPKSWAKILLVVLAAVVLVGLGVEAWIYVKHHGG